MLLGSIGVGLVSPALASGDLADRLRAEGIAPEALDAAMEAAAESESPAELAQAVMSALGESAPAPDVFLRALYGHLYQLLRFQQGMKAVSGASATTPQTNHPTPDGIPVEVIRRRAPASELAASHLAEDAPRPLPRVQHPAVQPLGP
ncbi:MAG: hypothetical protein IIC18_03035 [Bacteroidetes bacterium]|nr:hypothetical protein [Bacteroidota bacterium]